MLSGLAWRLWIDAREARSSSDMAVVLEKSWRIRNRYTRRSRSGGKNELEGKKGTSQGKRVSPAFPDVIAKSFDNCQDGPPTSHVIQVQSLNATLDRNFRSLNVDATGSSQFFDSWNWDAGI